MKAEDLQNEFVKETGVKVCDVGDYSEWLEKKVIASHFRPERVKEVFKPIENAERILKKIGYDNDSITPTEKWIAKEVYNMAISDLCGEQGEPIKKKRETGFEIHETGFGEEAGGY